MFKNLLIPMAAVCLLLSACEGNTLTVDLEFKTDDETIISLLTTASERVAERRVFGIENEIPDISVEGEGAKKLMVIKFKNSDTKEILANQLTEPINFMIMREAQKGEEPDVENEQFGAFVNTGLTEEHLEGLGAHESEDGKGNVIMAFTQEGKVLWKNIYDENSGKKIGIFVRGGLVSVLTVPDMEFQDTITIAGIPSMDLAKVFVDDVNVGTHVIFTPRF